MNMSLTELDHVRRWTGEEGEQGGDPGASPRRPKESGTKMVDYIGKGSWGRVLHLLGGKSLGWGAGHWAGGPCNRQGQSVRERENLSRRSLHQPAP